MGGAGLAIGRYDGGGAAIRDNAGAAAFRADTGVRPGADGLTATGLSSWVLVVEEGEGLLGAGCARFDCVGIRASFASSSFRGTEAEPDRLSRAGSLSTTVAIVASGDAGAGFAGAPAAARFPDRSSIPS